MYLANQACITPHIWLSRVDQLACPDQMVFDLDPSGDSFGTVQATARSLKALLDRLGLPAYLKTTGSRGLHVAVPLRRSEEFDPVRAFARVLAEIVVSQDPGQRTLEQRKSRRRGRVFVDVNRNAYAQTVAPAYAVRARRGAPVSVPLDWDELGKEGLRPDGATIRTVFDRLQKIGDPWADFCSEAPRSSERDRSSRSSMTLEEYQRRRNFSKTPEPAGRERPADHERIFVVQKHAARRLHYDFRLAINGVLASWAVPRGPSMNPSDKRLAIRTEDHPLEYADFEGVIPESQYGAGTVMVWDRGPYEPKEDVAPEEQLARDKIDVVLHGDKLRGGFTLVRTGGRSTDLDEGKRWLLVRHRDQYADPSWNVESPELDRSVLTGRTLKEIGEGARAKIPARTVPRERSEAQKPRR
jgi:DNA ligase D-like protein (predicted 3'-phosphoesterase)